MRMALHKNYSNNWLHCWMLSQLVGEFLWCNSYAMSIMLVQVNHLDGVCVIQIMDTNTV